MIGETKERRGAAHRSRILKTPWQGVYGVHTVSGRRFPKHWHDGYGLGVLEAGAHRSASGRGQVEAYAGDVIACNPGEIHDGRPLGTLTRSWRMLCIEQAAMASAIASSAREAEIVRPVIRDPLLGRALVRLIRRLERWHAMHTRPDIEALACEEALVETCELLIARHASPRATRAAPTDDLCRVRERLADDSPQLPTLGELATMAGLSKFQLLRRFDKAFGLPPHGWALHRRADRARSLIRSGSSLAAAAAETGFADQSHMTRVFVRHFGFTPGAWRRAMNEALQ